MMSDDIFIFDESGIILKGVKDKRNKSVTLPNSVTSIGDWAFSGCTALKSVIFPNSVKNIGVCAFSGCTALKSITIPNSVTYQMRK